MNLTEFLDKNKYIVAGVVVVIIAIILYSKKENFTDVSLEKSKVVIANPEDIHSNVIPKAVIVDTKDVKPEALAQVQQVVVSRNQLLDHIHATKVIMPISSEGAELSHKVLAHPSEIKEDVVVDKVVVPLKDVKSAALPNIKHTIVAPTDVKPGLVPSHSVVAHPAPVAVIAKPEDAKPSPDNLAIVKPSEVKSGVKPLNLIVAPSDAKVASHIIAPAVDEKSDLANKVIAKVEDVKPSAKATHVVVKASDVKPEVALKHVIVAPHEASKPTHVVIHNPAIIAPHTIIVKPEQVPKPLPSHHVIVKKDEAKPNVPIHAVVAKPSDVKPHVVAQHVLVPLSKDTGRVPVHGVVVPPSDLKHDANHTHVVILPKHMKENVIPHRVIVAPHEVPSHVIPCHSVVTLHEHSNATRTHTENNLVERELGPRPVGSLY